MAKRDASSGSRTEHQVGQEGRCTCCRATPEKIARQAYELWLRRGATHGHDVDDWLEAERSLKRERHAQRQRAAA